MAQLYVVGTLSGLVVDVSVPQTVVAPICNGLPLPASTRTTFRPARTPPQSAPPFLTILTDQLAPLPPSILPSSPSLTPS
jgi:hypothetical protein